MGLPKWQMDEEELEALLSSTPTPEQAAVLMFEAAKCDFPEMLRFAMGFGADPNSRDASGMTPLHHAAATDSREAVLYLIKTGRCDFLIQDHEGRYAYDMAMLWAKDFPLTRLLRKHQRRQAFLTGRPAWEPKHTARIYRPFEK